jgi:hypothetical protein
MNRVWVVAAAAAVAAVAQQPDKGWTASFVVNKSDLLSTGNSPYFRLEPGDVRTLEHGAVRLVITVTERTERVDGVDTRVVEERETDAGNLVEVSRNYFAFNPHTGSVFYFGEDVDMYKGGRVTGHEGSWRSGVKGARFGLMMPGQPLVEGRYYQEIAPGIAMDRARVVSVNDTLATPAGRFADVVVIEESTPIEPGKEYKRYAPGIGLVQDGDLKLISHKMR